MKKFFLSLLLLPTLLLAQQNRVVDPNNPPTIAVGATNVPLSLDTFGRLITNSGNPTGTAPFRVGQTNVPLSMDGRGRVLIANTGGGGGGGVTKIIAGTHITIDPITGVGDVTINSSGGGTPGGLDGDIQINNLGAFGGLTPGALIPAWLSIPSSSNLSAAMTDETGSGGLLVFNSNPVLVGYTLTAASVQVASTMASTVIDVSKPLLEKSITGNETWTFNNNTPTTGTIVRMDITADGTDRTVTLPLAGAIYSYDTGSSTPTAVIPAFVTKEWIFTKEASRWSVRGTGVATTGTGAFVLVNNPAVGIFSHTRTTLAANTTEAGYSFINSTAATSGNQSFSPAIYFQGQGWKTTATAASQPVEMRMYIRTVQGSTAPSAQLVIDSQINGTGGFVNGLTYGTDGLLIWGTNTSNAGISLNTSNYVGWANRARLKSNADGQATLFNNAESSFTRLNFGSSTSASFVSLQSSATTLTVGLADGTSGGGNLSVGGAVSLLTAGNTISVKSGANAMAGTVVLTAGIGTITSSAIDANTVIVLSVKTAGGTLGLSSPRSNVTGGSATITGAVTDTSTYNWVAFKVN